MGTDRSQPPPMNLQAILSAFGTVFPAELPDKTMIATVILVTRYRRPLAVWAGAAGALAAIAGVLRSGGLLSLLPDSVVSAVVGLLFAGGAVLLFRAARSAAVDAEATAEPVIGEVPDPAHRPEVGTREGNDGAPTAGGAPGPSAVAAVGGSFGLVVLAEWGDLTQLATASLAAKSGEPVSTAIGAYLALISVAAIAATFGRQLVARVPLHRINFVGASVFALLAAWTLSDLIR